MSTGMYPAAAGERAMKIPEVILRAIDGRLKWYEAAEILGISDRQMRRWKQRYERRGYDGLFDRRRRQPSPKRVAVDTVRQVLTLYREQYYDCNVLHFHFLSFHRGACAWAQRRGSHGLRTEGRNTARR